MFFKKYLEYINDNPKGYWFKRKLYGWGWVPVTWQGWLVIVAFTAYLIWIAMMLPNDADVTGEELTWFFIKEFVGIAAVLAICYKKGESPKWQWGKRK